MNVRGFQQEDAPKEPVKQPVKIKLKRVRLVMNPAARGGRGRRLWDTFAMHLRAAGCYAECIRTDNLDQARDLARECRGFEAVVAVGGDGTINAVLDGVLLASNPRLGFGVFYTGTSPAFCRFHGIPQEPAAAVQALLHAPWRRVDVARITYTDRMGAPVQAHFGCGCNLGLGADIARRANRNRRFLGDALGTGLAVLMTLFRASPITLTVECDGVSHMLRNVRNLSILKNPFIASGLKLQTGVTPTDGRLMAVAVRGLNPLPLLRLLPGFYSGRVVRHPALWMQPCRRIVIQGSAVQIEFDGDSHGFLPATIEILPRALNLLGAL